jgi:hypothetical protein
MAAGQAAGVVVGARIMQPFKRLLTLSRPEQEAALGQMNASGELARSVSTGQDAEDIAKLLYEMRLDCKARPELAPILKTIVDATQDYHLVELCISLRFGIPNVIGSSSSSQTTDWTLVSARRLWTALGSLPALHIEESNTINSLVRTDGGDGGGRYVAEDKSIRIGNAASLSEDPELRKRIAKLDTSQLAKEEQELLANNVFFVPRPAHDDLDEFDQSAFDATVRHEIGHSVDAQLGASKSYGSTLQGGGWVLHANGDQAIDVVLEAIHAEAAFGASAMPALKEYLSWMFCNSGLNMVDEERHNRLKGMCAGASVTLFNELEEAMRGSYEYIPKMAFGGRIFVNRDSLGAFSYDEAATHRRVSTYQFYTPSEWFAEAYSAYYDPTVARGQRLIDVGDADTKRYFDEHVHPFVAGKRQPQAPGAK